MADDIRLRPGVPSDAPTLAAINLATEIVDGEPPSPAGITPYFRHLVERGRVVVAEARDGTVVGFGAAVDTGRSRHLADLFVLPDRQSHGIGRRLLDGHGRPSRRTIRVRYRCTCGPAWPRGGRTCTCPATPRPCPPPIRT
jgi:GNAT superfamily N-acetyltransferase